MGIVVQMFPLPEILVGRISQATWDVMTPELRSETERMARELTKGLDKYRPASKRDAELAEYHALAKRSGTTLAEAFTRYVQVENRLRADPHSELVRIMRHVGISPEDWATVTLAGARPAHPMFLAHAAQAIRNDPERDWEGVCFGFMANEVQAVRPDCVVVMPNGFRAVDYDRLSKTPEARTLQVHVYRYKDGGDGSIPDEAA